MKKRRTPYTIIILLGYLAGIYHGKIALWSGEDPEPQIILPYAASLLPEADQTALKQGIRIGSGEELVRFMEDYCS